MEKASRDQSPRDEASTSNSAIISQLNSRSSSPQSVKPTKRHPALPPLREQTSKSKSVHPLAIRLPSDKTISPRPTVSVQSSFPNRIPSFRVEVEDEDSVDEEDDIFMRDAITPDGWNSYISFQLEHFHTGVKLRKDLDYGEEHSPVPIDSGFRRFFCANGSTRIRDIKQLLEEKFCRSRKYHIHMLHPKFKANLEENTTLTSLALETKWRRHRPLKILFTLIPPKEPPPSLEKVPMRVMEEEAAEEPIVEPEEEEIQIINTATMQIHQQQMVFTQQIQNNPELQRQIHMQMQTPQYALINNQMMTRVAPVKRKRDSSETTPPQQPTAQMQQRGQQSVMQMRMNPQNLTPQQVQQLQQHYIQQKQMMAHEAKSVRMPVMTNSQGVNLFPVHVKAVSASQSSGQTATPPPAAILHKLLLQQQAQKHQQQQRLKEQQAAVQQHQQRTAQAQHLQHIRQLQIQAQAVHAAKAAQAMNQIQPPSAKKMALQEALEKTPKMEKPPTMSTPVSAGSTPDITPTTPRAPSANNAEKKFHVPSPPSPPKPQVVAATPSPPAISPIPPRTKTELKPFAAQVSVQPITNVKTTSPPPPALSPVIPNNIDYVEEAKLRGQPLGLTLKHALSKNHQKSPMDGIRAQHVNGELQLSASTMEVLRNSTIVPTL